MFRKKGFGVQGSGMNGDSADVGEGFSFGLLRTLRLSKGIPSRPSAGRSSKLLLAKKEGFSLPR